MTQILESAVDRLRALPEDEQDRIGRRLLDELPPDATTEANEPQSLGDWLAPYIGTFDSREIVSGGARLSENTGRTFAEGMVEKRKRGRL